MKLTIDNWSYKNIKEEIKDFTHVEKVELAAFCAEKVIAIFESKCPDDKRPRLAIEAAKEFIKNPTDENKQRCKKAAGAAAYAAADAADAAADAADADAADAADAFYVADAANAADAADAFYVAVTYTADDADTAADKTQSLKQKIIDYIKELKVEKMTEETKEQKDKPVYTQEMADNGELPPVGSSVVLRYNFDSKTVTHAGIVLFSSAGNCILATDYGESHFNIGDYIYEAIDTRTDEEKLIDEMENLITEHCSSNGTLRDLPRTFLEHYDITPK